MKILILKFCNGSFSYWLNVTLKICFNAVCFFFPLGFRYSNFELNQNSSPFAGNGKNERNIEHFFPYKKKIHN